MNGLTPEHLLPCNLKLHIWVTGAYKEKTENTRETLLFFRIKNSTSNRQCVFNKFQLTMHDEKVFSPNAQRICLHSICTYMSHRYSLALSQENTSFDLSNYFLTEIVVHTPLKAKGENDSGLLYKRVTSNEC